MTQSYWQASLREPTLEVDVAVVGGGIAGCSLAYWLKRARPSLDVAILEAGRLAHGASGRNAGFILQGISSDYVLDVERYGRERARELWQRTLENRNLLTAELDASRFEFEETGSVVAAGSEEEDERLRRAEQLLREDGIEATYLAAEEVNKRLGAREFRGGLFVPTGAVCHPARLVRAIASASGADVYEHHRVVGAEAVGERVRLETTGRVVYPERAVFCLNGYLGQLFPDLEAEIRPVRAQMLATQPLGKRPLEVPVYSHDGYYYLRQLRGGEVLLGGARHLHEADEVGYEDATTEALQADLHAYLEKHFPRFSQAAVHCRWSGVMGFSEDRLPRLRPLPAVPGTWMLGGFTGHGMALGFGVGRQISKVLLG